MRLFGRKGMAAGLVALLAACSEPTGITGTEMELQAAHRLWDVQGVDDYRMRVRLTGAWLGGAAVIQVRNGVPVSVQVVESQGTPTFAEIWSSYDTVEELFAILHHAVDEDADHIDATFHARYGLPVQASIDFRERTADDEMGFTVETFDRL
jgi:hypothetical protein